MSKSPLRDYTTILEQSRTKKKPQPYTSVPSFERSSYQSGRNYEGSNYKYSSGLSDDLQMKLELSLKHNTRLLDENSSLSERISELKFDLQSAQDDVSMLKRQQEDQLRANAKERETLLMENEIKQSTHEQELKRLLDEVSSLQEEKNNLQIEKNKELETVKAEFEKNLLAQMQNIRSVQANTKEIYEAQVSNLKETITKQEFEMENLKAVEKLERNRLKDQIEAMHRETVHMKNSFEIELREAKREFEASVNSERKRSEQERELESKGYSLKMKRLKKELLDKAEDLEMVNKKMYQQEEASQVESLHFRRDKENLLAELTNNEINAKTELMKEKTKLEELTRLEIDNLTQLQETNIEQLQGEVNRLRLLIDCKTEEIKDVYQENRRVKDSYGAENELLLNENRKLKETMKSQEKLFREQEEASKVKLAQLIETNLKQLSSYFEHELSNVTLHNRDLENLNRDLKERIYRLLQDNDQTRKNFEIESSKYRARIQDLKIKLASINLEHKEHIGSLSSKVELTSQTIIRDTENKERSKVFYEEEKRKLHSLASQKETDIINLMEELKKVKVMHEDELKVIRAEKDGYREDIEKLQQDKIAIKENLERELLNKEEKLKNLKYDNQKEIEEINELEEKIDEVEKENIKLKKQFDHLKMTYESVAAELGLSKGHIESIMLESNANIEEEKNKIRMLMGKHEVTLKEYYEDKVKGKNAQIDSLERTLKEKEEDIRDLIVKYNALEKRLAMVMENQGKLTEFEEKVKKLGLDDSLIKGMAELFMKKGGK